MELFSLSSNVLVQNVGSQKNCCLKKCQESFHIGIVKMLRKFQWWETEVNFVIDQSADLFTKIISHSDTFILIQFVHSAILKWSFNRECHRLQLLPLGRNHAYLQRRNFGLTFMAAFLSKFLRPYAIARTVSNIFVVENHPSIIYYPTSPSRSFSSISESKPSLFLCNVELGMANGYWSKTR